MIMVLLLYCIYLLVTVTSVVFLVQIGNWLAITMAILSVLYCIMNIMIFLIMAFDLEKRRKADETKGKEYVK